MATVARITEGRTTRLTFTLLSDGAAMDGSGITVSDLLITGRDGRPVATTGDFGWVSAAAGTVYYDPDASDFVASKSPYRIRWKLTDGSGGVAFHPEGPADTIEVSPVR
jgi:hypothetical protein